MIALIGAQMFHVARSWAEGNAVDANPPSSLLSRPIIDELRLADIESTVRAIRLGIKHCQADGTAIQKAVFVSEPVRSRS